MQVVKVKDNACNLLNAVSNTNKGLPKLACVLSLMSLFTVSRCLNQIHVPPISHLKCVRYAGVMQLELMN